MIQEFTEAIKKSIKEALSDMHTVMVGRVVQFYPDTCEADVSPYGVYRKPGGGTVSFPRLCRVPIFFMQGAGQTAAIVYPIKSGDDCIVMFSEQAHDFWRTGTSSNTDLRFDLSNAIAIVGLFSRPNPLVAEAVRRDAVIIDRGGSRISLLPGNKIEVVGDVTVTGNLTVTGQIN